MEPPPTALLDRTNDSVYECTTNVVRAIMTLTTGKLFICKARKFPKLSYTVKKNDNKIY